MCVEWHRLVAAGHDALALISSRKSPFMTHTLAVITSQRTRERVGIAAPPYRGRVGMPPPSITITTTIPIVESFEMSHVISCHYYASIVFHIEIQFWVSWLLLS